jgi:hypothetical protein
VRRFAFSGRLSIFRPPFLAMNALWFERVQWTNRQVYDSQIARDGGDRDYPAA